MAIMWALIFDIQQSSKGVTDLLVEFDHYKPYQIPDKKPLSENIEVIHFVVLIYSNWDDNKYKGIKVSSLGGLVLGL